MDVVTWLIQKPVVDILDHTYLMYASQWKTEYMTVLNMFKLLVQNWSIFSLVSEKYVFLHTPYLEGEWVQDKPTDSSI